MELTILQNKVEEYAKTYKTLESVAERTKLDVEVRHLLDKECPFQVLNAMKSYYVYLKEKTK